MCVEGACLPEAVPWLCAANLHPLKKDDGGIRPIAVGEVLRRITAKWLLKTDEAREVTNWMAPEQIAFEKGGPCEALAMGVQEALHLLRDNSDLVVLRYQAITNR